MTADVSDNVSIPRDVAREAVTSSGARASQSRSVNPARSRNRGADLTPLEWISAAQARCDAATPGEWVGEWHNANGCYAVYAGKGKSRRFIGSTAFGAGGSDADFIAAARTDSPRALAALTDVLELHVPEWVVIDYVGGFVCAECREPVESEPCRTVRAITDALEGL